MPSVGVFGIYFAWCFLSFLELVLMSDISLGKFSVTMVSNISSVPFSLSSPSGIQLYIYYTFCSCLTDFGNSGKHFQSWFSLLFSFQGFF